MKQTRFFQHLNENDSDFQKVTTLDFIDNSEGFTMYYFKDGSKCNKNYIAPVNSNTIKGYEFAEVSSKTNIWHLKKVEPQITEKPKPAVGQDGVLYEPPTWEDLTGNYGKTAKARVDVVAAPMIIENYIAPADSDYLFNYDEYNVSNNSVEEATIIKDKLKAETFDFNDSNAIKSNKKEQTLNKLAEVSVVGDTVYIHIGSFMKNIQNVTFIYENGNHYDMTTDEFIDNALTPKEEKIVEKLVEKEVKVSDSDIDLGIDSTQKALLDNMIDMSNKNDCTFDMELTLKLPPASVFKLIKSVYPNGMDRGFVNILANRMQIKELKSGVANALFAFYDDEYTENQNTSEDSNTEEKLAKKANRKK